MKKTTCCQRGDLQIKKMMLLQCCVLRIECCPVLVLERHQDKEIAWPNQTSDFIRVMLKEHRLKIITSCITDFKVLNAQKDNKQSLNLASWRDVEIKLSLSSMFFQRYQNTVNSVLKCGNEMNENFHSWFIASQTILTIIPEIKTPVWSKICNIIPSELSGNISRPDVNER